MLRRVFDAPAFRFLFAGGLAAAVNWLVRFPLSTLMPFAAAIVAAQVVGWGIGFVLYRRFVFGPSGRSLWHEMRAFMAVNLASLLGVLAVTLALDRVMHAAGLGEALAEAVSHAAGIAAGAVLNFLGHRTFTFAAARTVPRLRRSSVHQHPNRPR